MADLRRTPRSDPTRERTDLPVSGNYVDRRTDDPAAGYLPPQHMEDRDVDPWATQDRDVGTYITPDYITPEYITPEQETTPWNPQDRDDWVARAGQPTTQEPVRSAQGPRIAASAPPPVSAAEPQAGWRAEPAPGEPESTQEQNQNQGAAAGPEQGPAMSRPSAMTASAPAMVPLLGGIWLLVSRLLFDFPAAGATADGLVNGIVIGVAVAFVALARMTTASSNPVLGLVLTALGGWMIAAPWVFDYNQFSGAGYGATWSDVVTGGAIALFGLATWAAGTVRQLGVAGRKER